MKFLQLYHSILTVVLTFTVLIASDMLGQYNPLRMIANEWPWIGIM